MNNKVLASIASIKTTLASLKTKNDNAGNKNYISVINLPLSNWDSSAQTQTVTVSGIKSNELEQIVRVSPWSTNPDNAKAYYNFGIRAISQAENSLTFYAKTIPTSDLKVVVSYVYGKINLPKKVTENT